MEAVGERIGIKVVCPGCGGEGEVTWLEGRDNPRKTQVPIEGDTLDCFGCGYRMTVVPDGVK